MGRGKRFKYEGEMLDLQQALYHAVHDFKPGGAGAVAGVFGWDKETLSKELNPAVSTHKPGPERIEGILQVTRDPRILTALCQPIGAVWLWQAAVDKPAADMDLLEQGAGLVSSVSALINEVVQALDDNKVDALEMRCIQQRAFDLLQKVKGLETTAAQFAS